MLYFKTNEFVNKFPNKDNINDNTIEEVPIVTTLKGKGKAYTISSTPRRP